MKGFKPGDFFVAYLKGHGFVGVGRVKTEARMVREARVNGNAYSHCLCAAVI